MSDKDFVVKNGIVVNGNVTLSNTTAIIANSSPGSNGQVLTSNGSAAYWSSSSGGSSLSIEQIDDITSQFDGYRREFAISYDGTSYSPPSPVSMTVFLGGVHIRPSKYYEDYVNQPIIPVFQSGFVVNGSNIIFSAPPTQSMGFYGTVDTGTTQYPAFKYITSNFKPLALMIGTD